MAFLRNQWITTQDIGLIFEEGGSPWREALAGIELLNAADDSPVAGASYEAAQPGGSDGTTGRHAAVKVLDISGSFKLRVTAEAGVTATSAAFDVGASLPHDSVSQPAQMSGFSASQSNMWADYAKTTPLGPATGTPQPIAVISDAAGNRPDLRAHNETTGRPNLVLVGGKPVIDFGDGSVPKGFKAQGSLWNISNPDANSSFFFVGGKITNTGTFTFNCIASAVTLRPGVDWSGSAFLWRKEGDGSTLASAPFAKDANSHSFFLPWQRFGSMNPVVDGVELSFDTAPNNFTETMSTIAAGYRPYGNDRIWVGYMTDWWVYLNTGSATMPTGERDAVLAFIDENKPA